MFDGCFRVLCVVCKVGIKVGYPGLPWPPPLLGPLWRGRCGNVARTGSVAGPLWPVLAHAGCRARRVLVVGGCTGSVELRLFGVPRCRLRRGLLGDFVFLGVLIVQSRGVPRGLGSLAGAPIDIEIDLCTYLRLMIPK